MLSSVSCDEFLNELLEDPKAEEITDDGGYTGTAKKTTEKKTEKVTEEYLETESEEIVGPGGIYVPEITTIVWATEYPTEYPTEMPTETPTVRPPEYTSDYYEPECSHCECAWIGGCHYCEFCGEKRWDCNDDNGDHLCDGCYAKLTNCVDYNKDNYCDICGLSSIPSLSSNGKAASDTYKENGIIMADGNANNWIANNRFDGITGVDNISFRGWAFLGDGITTEIVDFGYGFLQVEGITWGFAPIVDETIFAPLGGRTATRRYDISIDLTGLATGEYDVLLYVKDADGNVYWMDIWGDVWVNHTYVDVPTSIATDKEAYSEGEFIYVNASHKGAAYVGIAPAGTTNWLAYYVMGEQEGFTDIPAGTYDVVLCDMAVNILKSVTIKVMPANIVATYGAADLAVRTNEPFGATFGCTPSLSEDGTYVTLTMDADAYNAALQGTQGTEYNWYVAFPSIYNMPAFNYMVIKYRSEATNIDKNELFLGTTASPFPFNINFTDKMVCDGNWNYLYINFEDYGVTDMDTLSILRFDFINGAPSGSTIDIEYINFYNTAEDAYKSTIESLVFQNPSDFANISNTVQIATENNVSFAPIVNAINSFNPNMQIGEEGCYAISGDGILWLSDPENPIDLSKYSKAVITFTMDASEVTQKAWEATDPSNKFEILNFQGTLATGDYTLPAGSWQWNTCEIDLTGVDYNGEVLIRMYMDGLPGNWYVIHSIVLVP